jgi:CspA family cold shock protein
MDKGKIKWYDETKGFGFVEVEDSKDVFIHRTGLADRYHQPEEGEMVEFEIKEGEKGPIAVNLKKIS